MICTFCCCRKRWPEDFPHHLYAVCRTCWPLWTGDRIDGPGGGSDG